MECFKINRNVSQIQTKLLLTTEVGLDNSGVFLFEDISAGTVSFDIERDKLNGVCVGDILYFRKRVGDNIYSETSVVVREINNTTIVTDIPGYNEVINIVSVDTSLNTDENASTAETFTNDNNDDELGERIFGINLDKSYAFIPGDYDKFWELGRDITARTSSVTDDTWTGWTLSPVYRKYNTVDEPQSAKTNSDIFNTSEVNTYAFGVNNTLPSGVTLENVEGLLPLTFVTDINRYFYVIDDEPTSGNTMCQFFDNVEVVKKLNYYEIKTNITRCDEIDLLKQNTVSDLFTEEIKSKIVPPFIDMEKEMYEPTMDVTGRKLLSEMIFHLHFRRRNMDKSWSVIENEGWNNVNAGVSIVALDASGNTIVNTAITDTVSNLNFTDEDIQFQKMKVKKSFLRLSYYDTDNPLTQQLLGYSTIFLDSGELFGEYIRITPTSSADTRVSHIPCSVSIENMYNTNKSSEGFYLYLFPSDTPSNMPPKDIFMKVEFNHAGYGRTLPMIKANLDANNSPQMIDVGDYYKYAFIKLSAFQVNTSENRYVYYFNDDYVGVVKDKNKNIVELILFEPWIE